jgi:cold shock CspA family protein
MRVPLEISYRNVEKSEFLEELIREKAAKLERICEDIISCRVVVEKPQEHQRSGNPYRVRIDVRLPPGKEVIAERGLGQGSLHDPLPKVIRSAFETAAKQLREIVKRRLDRGRPAEELEDMALVSKIFRKDGYGFIRDLAGREIYFHKNSVLHGDYDRLEVGTGVRFVETKGEEGPQASTVQIVNKPGVRTARSEDRGALPEV